ncbi:MULTISPECIES: phytoene desaturase family protein [Pontibacillus]|uniref:4,4'-diaponeurosporene oxygenase n=1 Tax=Pontibacillus chungwhensis TaxID=265426 RepID=A0ABY8V1C5_9BACI|nr:MULTISPECIES: phytoene desaturase family protein [Pontibacillus]MCD5322471.1 phytoene desaturase [Pontibacillus sp. HN14]WIF99756.1 phytoene desaturase family protein [Pontibacillus chungwhensis]
MKNIVIVGGGLAGLSAAIHLASEGHQVKVFEKNEHFGGKMKSIDLGSYHFDFGPNTITMPQVFIETIKKAGLNPADYISFKKIEHHTRNVFPDGFVFDLSSSSSFMKEQLKKLDPKGSSRYPEFLKKIESLYTLSHKYFLHRTFESFRDYLSPSLGRALLKVRPNQTMHDFFHTYFENPKTIQALDRYATYIGSNPYVAPATFAMIAYLELVEGVYYVEGGNTKIADAFVQAALHLGVELFGHKMVSRIETSGGEASGVYLESGEFIHADEIIINGDLLKAYPNLVKEEDRPSFTNKRVREYEPSISGFVILAGLDGKMEQLHHHHLFFSNNYKKEFTQLQNGEYPGDPTIYICTSSKSDPTVSPNGDNCFILVNAPATGKDRVPIDPEAYKEVIYKKLERFGLSIREKIQVEKIYTPEDLRVDFGAFRGSIYGPAANKKKDAFLRPFNRSQDIKNVWFAGGSTHPGGGSPMVVLSGQNVARAIHNKHS